MRGWLVWVGFPDDVILWNESDLTDGAMIGNLAGISLTVWTLIISISEWITTGAEERLLLKICSGKC